MKKSRNRFSSRLLSIFLSLAIILSIGVGASAVGVFPYKDVNQDAWYYEAVNYCWENGLFADADGTSFGPGDLITRAQFVAALSKLAETMGYTMEDYSGSESFDDVSAGIWYDAAVGWANAAGIVSGVSETSFDPDAEVTREQMACLMVRFVEALKLRLPEINKVQFSDAASISDWAADSVAAAASAGIIFGHDDGSFEPTPNATRAEAAAMISRLGNMIVIVDKTTVYDSGLTMQPDEIYTVASGYALTMTVDGVEQTVAPGTYEGKVVLIVTEAEYTTFGRENIGNRYALYYNDNGLNNAKSAVEAVVSGDYDTTLLKDIVLRSHTALRAYRDSFTGIAVAVGKEYNTANILREVPMTLQEALSDDTVYDYVIADPDIAFSGPGGSDTIGFGASILIANESRVKLTGTLSNDDIITAASILREDPNADLTAAYTPNINNEGQVRTAITGTGHSVVVTDGLYIKGSDGEWVEGYRGKISGMKSVPWILGLIGNNRITTLIDNATGYYLNSIIESENWGALANDEASGGSVFITAYNSVIRISGESGYAAYSISNGQTNFIDSYVWTPDYALIVADGENINTFDNTEVYSDRFGMMFHTSSSANTLTTVTGGSSFHVGDTFALFKAKTGASYNVVVEKDSTIEFTNDSTKNILLQYMDSDDPGPDDPANGVWTTYNSSLDPVWAAANDGATTEEAATAYYEQQQKGITASAEVASTATFDAVTVEGDIYNAAIAAGQTLGVTLSGGASLTGVISSSVAVHNQEVLTSPWSPEGGFDANNKDYKQLGVVNNFVYPALGNGIVVTLSENSVWVVTGTSYLTGLTIGQDASLEALSGYKMSMTVDGVDVEPATGSYSGEIVITITALS